MATTSVTIRMDKGLKEYVEVLFEDMGMNMTTAFTIFAKAVARKGKIPFEIEGDPFYCESNMKVLRESIKEANEGKLTHHELIEV